MYLSTLEFHPKTFKSYSLSFLKVLSFALTRLDRKESEH